FLQLNARSAQPARAIARRKRHGIGKFGVIVEAVATVSIGPAPIKNVLTVRVGFYKKRNGDYQLIVFTHEQMVRLPTTGSGGAARVFKRSEKFMASKWIVGCAECVPFFGTNSVDGRDKIYLHTT